MEVIITNWQEDFALTPEMEQMFYRLGETAAREFSLAANTTVDVILVDDEEMRRLNAEYRGIDATTDVLSFAMQDPVEEEIAFPEEEAALLGDIVISVPRAVLQSAEYGHSISREIGFLLVHGLLHLLGYDHETADGERSMFALQEKILQLAGVQRDV